MKVNGILAAIRTTLSGLSGQMRRMEIISENIANAEKSPDEKGNVYQRKIIVSPYKKQPKRIFNQELQMQLKRTNPNHLVSKNNDPLRRDEPMKLKIQQVKGEKLVYNPAHPMADENGYVKMPNVNLAEEMVDLISASRSYEANVTVINAAKLMAKKSLEI